MFKRYSFQNLPSWCACIKWIPTSWRNSRTNRLNAPQLWKQQVNGFAHFSLLCKTILNIKRIDAEVQTNRIPFQSVLSVLGSHHQSSFGWNWQDCICVSTALKSSSRFGRQSPVLVQFKTEPKLNAGHWWMNHWCNIPVHAHVPVCVSICVCPSPRLCSDHTWRSMVHSDHYAIGLVPGAGSDWGCM